MYVPRFARPCATIGRSSESTTNPFARASKLVCEECMPSDRRDAIRTFGRNDDGDEPRPARSSFEIAPGPRKRHRRRAQHLARHCRAKSGPQSFGRSSWQTSDFREDRSPASHRSPRAPSVYRDVRANRGRRRRVHPEHRQRAEPNRERQRKNLRSRERRLQLRARVVLLLRFVPVRLLRAVCESARRQAHAARRLTRNDSNRALVPRPAVAPDRRARRRSR